MDSWTLNIEVVVPLPFEDTGFSVVASAAMIRAGARVCGGVISDLSIDDGGTCSPCDNGDLLECSDTFLATTSHPWQTAA